MPDIEQTIQEQLAVSASGYRSGYRFDVLESITATPSGFNVPPKELSESLNITPSGDFSYNQQVGESVYIGEVINPNPSGSYQGDENISIIPTINDGTNNSIEQSDNVYLIDLSHQEDPNDPPADELIGMNMLDSSSYLKEVRPIDVLSVSGDFFGRVEIDVICYDESGSDVSVEFKDGYVWRTASCSGNLSLSGSPSGIQHTMWWNIVDDIYSDMTTPIRIYDGKEYFVTDPISVSTPKGNNVFPILSMNGLQTPASGYYMPIKYAAVNPDHYPIDGVNISSNQYVEDPDRLYNYGFEDNVSEFIRTMDAGENVYFKEIELLSKIVGDSSIDVYFRVVPAEQAVDQLDGVSWKQTLGTINKIGRWIQYKLVLNASSTTEEGVLPQVKQVSVKYIKNFTLDLLSWGSHPVNSKVYNTSKDWGSCAVASGVYYYDGTISLNEAYWSNRVKIEINRTNIESFEQDYEFYFTTPSGIAETANVDSIRLFDAYGNKLPVEIEYHKVSTAELSVWTKINLSSYKNSSENQHIWMYYNNADAPYVEKSSEYGMYNVWNKHYGFVCHGSEVTADYVPGLLGYDKGGVGGSMNSRANFEANATNMNGPVTVSIPTGGSSCVNGYTDTFLQKFEGYIYCDETGTYTFGTNSDDASDLSINGTVVCSYYGNHGAIGYQTGNIYLEAGYHKFVYYHHEYTGGQSCSAAWTKPSGGGLVVIPSSVFFNDAIGPVHDSTRNQNYIYPYTYSTGIWTGTRMFINDNEYSVNTNPVGLPKIDDDKTVEMVVRMSDLPPSGYVALVSMGNDDSAHTLMVDASGHICYGDVGYNVCSASGVVLHQEYHITSVFDYNNSSVDLYINGEKDSSHILEVVPSGIPSKLVIGGRTDQTLSSRCFVEELRIISEKLPPKRIKTNYNVWKSSSRAIFGTPESGEYYILEGNATLSPSGHISDVIDAGRTVDWGKMFIVASGVVESDFKVRSSDTEGGLSTSVWTNPSGKYIFPSPSGGRYLEWSLDLNSGYLDSLAFRYWDDAYFYPDEQNFSGMTVNNVDTTGNIVTVQSGQTSGTISHTTDAIVDKIWAFLGENSVVPIDSSIDFKYKIATDAEGSGALPGKSWLDVPASGLPPTASGRYFAWQATLNTSPSQESPELMNVILGFEPNYDIVEFNYPTPSGTVYPSGYQGMLYLKGRGFDDTRSITSDSGTVSKGCVVVDSEINTVGVAPIFIWNNITDTDLPVQPVTYEFQTLEHEFINKFDLKEKKYIDTSSYVSKDPEIVVSASSYYLNAGPSGVINQIVQQVSASGALVWDRFRTQDNAVTYNKSYDIEYELRSSIAPSGSWTDWQRVVDGQNVLILSDSVQLRTTFRKYHGTSTPAVTSAWFETRDGTGVVLVEENQLGSTTSIDYADIGNLANESFNYYRIRAFDGSYFTKWSRVHAVYVSSTGAPFAPSGLLAEYQTDPNRLITFNPYLSWTFNDSESDPQSHARVQVGTTEGVWDVWDTGKAPLPSGIVYGSSVPDEQIPDIPLQRGIQYVWRVRTWEDTPKNLGSPYSEVATFQLNQLPTKPDAIRAED